MTSGEGRAMRPVMHTLEPDGDFSTPTLSNSGVVMVDFDA